MDINQAMKNIKRGSSLIRILAGFLFPADNIDEFGAKVLTKVGKFVNNFFNKRKKDVLLKFCECLLNVKTCHFV
jgi:hypothetical protein